MDKRQMGFYIECTKSSFNIVNRLEKQRTKTIMVQGVTISRNKGNIVESNRFLPNTRDWDRKFSNKTPVLSGHCI